MVTLTQLEYIVAVDTHRHFATAADSCFITQPTLSMQIKKLEEFLDITIFDRSKQPIIPTDVGIQIIEQARIILGESKKIDEIVKNHRDTVEGSLKIGIIPTLAPFLLPMFIGDYIRNYPDVKVEVEEMVSDDIVSALKKDLLDVGVFVTPLKDDKIKEVPLFYEEMMIYANKDHEILKQEVIEVKDIATSEIWMLGDGHCFRNQVINLCEMHSMQHQELPFEFESNSLETLMKIIDREGGFTLIPELATQYMSAEKLKQVKSFTNLHPLREVSLVYSRHYSKNKLLNLLGEHIKKMIPTAYLEKNRGTIVEWN
ncbi:LysR family hydrogen peroxide-inducible transcriptional activator [Ancylomarina subtilis]|uniref:LysR family hydrogen peroxide-inducible transcriptional activator n=1 Tax=Ancylomarina subtilis TaxID=1639035 RepID=A0A4Q7VLV0_9BACT|nr:hydrogen peroxide-inducible genes activator [Ancylomarina subtilis]RZT97260.1 LysR family hydrogen peroxide-inducible transcriptional activator [Ancylomarina subtilis]